jgi:hypothetical protein
MALTQAPEALAKLGCKKEEAIVALLSHRTVEDAARACNKRPRTLFRWLNEPDFRAAYKQARRIAFSQSIARLQQASSAAASTLLKVMLDPASSASARVGAAKAVLDHTAKGIEIEDLEERLAAIEKDNSKNWVERERS